MTDVTNTESVRVRFAPSPTGHLHIGNARTAIMNWIFARHARGTLVLRIEDTDVERSTAESEKSILADLHWLGLNWDEGPDVGGDYGPYRQSERLEIYREHARSLLDAGSAYHCYCTPEELEMRRKKALADEKSLLYDGRCRTLTEAQRNAFEREGRKPVVRFRVPDQDLMFRDLIRGEVTFPVGSVGDFVILRSGGIPTYNFAAAVDDHLMAISHVIRGDDHVSNTPKQLVLYQAFGWALPRFAHIPMILGEDRTRLSKRHGATSVDQFAREGYLPDALVNHLSLLSWSSESGDEILSRERLIREFDFARVSKSAAIFDIQKLNWMNGVYIRSLPVSELVQRSIPFLRQAGYTLPERDKLVKIIAAVQDKVERLSEIPAQVEIFFAKQVVPENAEAEAILKKDSAQKVFWSFLRQAEWVENLTSENFRKIMKVVGKETGVIGKDLWMPVRVALTGKVHGPELPMVVEVFGKSRCVELIRNQVEG